MLTRLRGLAELDLVRAVGACQSSLQGQPPLLLPGTEPQQSSPSHSAHHTTVGPRSTLLRFQMTRTQPYMSTAAAALAQPTEAQPTPDPEPDPGASAASSSPPLDREALLSAALEHVHTYGWSNDALVAAARDHGLSPAVAGILGAGEADLVNYFVQRCNTQLQEVLDARQADLAQMGTTQIVRFCIQTRLEMIQPYISSWPQALSIVAQPAHLPAYLRLMLGLVDTIWQAAGDRSVDSSWYTKRLLLSGVYAATELYMLSDFSPAFADTWEALDRRLADVASAGKMSRDLGQFVASVGKTATSGLASLMEVADKK